MANKVVVNRGNFNTLVNDNAKLSGASFTGDVSIDGSLNVTGITTTVRNLDISDSLIGLNNGLTGANTNDSGLIIERGSTGDNAFMGWDESADKFTLGTTAGTAASLGNLTITTGTLVANLEGNVTGDVTGNLAGSKTQNHVYAGPSAGGNGNASFRALVSADIPNNGADTTGNATTATTATTAGTVTTAAQPNITSVGTLTSLTISGDIVDSITTNAANVFATSTGKTTLGGGAVDIGASGSATTVKGTLGVTEAATFTAGSQTAAVARTATVDGTGTGTIAAGTSFVTVTCDQVDKIIILPAPVVGNIIHLMNGATGYELRTSNPASIAINGGSAADAESAVAANTLVRCICTSSTTWIARTFGTDGTANALDPAA